MVAGTYQVYHDDKQCPGGAVRIFGIAHLPTTNEVLCAGRDGSIHRWTRATGERALTWRPHQTQVGPMAVSPDEKWLLSCGTYQVVEHRIARLVQLGIRQSRDFGRAKTRFQLLLAATVANLKLLAEAASTPAALLLRALLAALLVTGATMPLIGHPATQPPPARTWPAFSG